MAETTVRGLVGDSEVVLKAGKLAGLANGAVTVGIGQTEVLVTAAANASIREGIDFFPLTVDVEERMYAAGKIPGSFFRREGRATERAILTARLIDRPLRPSFADGYRNDTHVVATILQVDGENPYDVIALNGASAALSISDIPFEGPLAGVRLALIDGEWKPFPTFEDLEAAVFDLVVAGGRNEDGEIDIIMVEAGSTEHGIRLIAEGRPKSDEDAVAGGLEASKAFISQLIDLQLELKAQVGKEPGGWPLQIDYSDEIYAKIEELAGSKLAATLGISDKTERTAAETVIWDEVLEAFGSEDDDEVRQAKRAFRSVSKKLMRDRVVNDGIRLDGRSATADPARPGRSRAPAACPACRRWPWTTSGWK